MPEPDYEILIVGLGPVGVTMANLLAARGIRLAVVEQARGIYDKPRAISLDHEVMRTFQSFGAGQRIGQMIAPHPGTHFLGMDGRVIKIFDPLPPPHPLGWPPNVTFVQPELEGALREELARRPSADVLLGYRLTDLAQDRARVTATIEDEAGAARRISARFLVACDGANSFVRRRLGIDLEDLAFDEWWMVVDTRLRGSIPLPYKSFQYCWPQRPATFVPGPRDLRRWEIKLLPGEDPEAFGRPDNVVAQLARFVDPSSVEIWRSAVYRFHAVVAQRWRQNRVFLAGDAAHQMPPFLGQGLCAGMRDAANLGWKLVLALRVDARDALLDSYEQERKPHVRTVVATAKAFGEIIGELDPVVAQARDKKLRGALERGEAETIRQRHIPDLSAGVIDRGTGGMLFVQPRIRTERGEQLLDDVVKPGFLLATTDADVPGWLTPRSRAVWERTGGQWAVIPECDGVFREWAERHGCTAALVRPDRYVFGLARTPAELNRLIESLGTHLFAESQTCANIASAADLKFLHQ